MVINIDTDKCKNPQLAATAAGMVSEDYKERFIAEYIQLKNRFEGLVKMVERWDNGTRPFTPTCPREIYNFRLREMKDYLREIKDYLRILVIRAKIEGIVLP